MKTSLIVPVKSFDEAKSRLSAILSSHERRQLCLTMLTDVLKAASSSKLIHSITVVGGGLEAQLVARRLSANHLEDDGTSLNRAIEQANIRSTREGAEATLMLPADIPLLVQEDVDCMVNFASELPSIVISPSRDGGTNGLLRCPPDLMPTFFGPDSYRRHVEEAERRGLRLRIYSSARVALDIDAPKDVVDLMSLYSKAETSTQRFLSEINMLERVADKTRL